MPSAKLMEDSLMVLKANTSGNCAKASPFKLGVMDFRRSVQHMQVKFMLVFSVNSHSWKSPQLVVRVSSSCYFAEIWGEVK